MSDDEIVYPPTDGKVQRFATSTTPTLTQLIASLRGMGWLRLKAVGADVDVLLGNLGDTLLTKNQVGGGGVGSGVGYTIASGTWEDFWNPGGAFGYVNWVAAGSGFLVVMRAGRDRVKDY